jgi:hypothetical protein
MKIEVAARGTTLQAATAEAFRLWLSSKVATGPRDEATRTEVEAELGNSVVAAAAWSASTNSSPPRRC